MLIGAGGVDRNFSGERRRLGELLGVEENSRATRLGWLCYNEYLVQNPSLVQEDFSRY